MSLTNFRKFCKKFNYQLQLIETTTIIIIFLLLLFVFTQHYFLQYKVVLVEENVNGEYIVLKEIITNGKITDSIYDFDIDTPPHNGLSRIKIENGNYNVKDINLTFP